MMDTINSIFNYALFCCGIRYEKWHTPSNYWLYMI